MFLGLLACVHHKVLVLACCLLLLLYKKHRAIRMVSHDAW